MRTLPLREGAPGPGAKFSSDPSLQRQSHFFSPHPGIVTACPVIRHGPRHQLRQIETRFEGALFRIKCAFYVTFTEFLQLYYGALVSIVVTYREHPGPCFYMNFFRLLPDARTQRSTTGFCVSPISVSQTFAPKSHQCPICSVAGTGCHQFTDSEIKL
jgi:hypothetical protein